MLTVDKLALALILNNVFSEISIVFALLVFMWPTKKSSRICCVKWIISFVPVLFPI